MNFSYEVGWVILGRTPNSAVNSTVAIAKQPGTPERLAIATASYGGC